MTECDSFLVNNGYYTSNFFKNENTTVWTKAGTKGTTLVLCTYTEKAINKKEKLPTFSYSTKSGIAAQALLKKLAALDYKVDNMKSEENNIIVEFKSDKYPRKNIKVQATYKYENRISKMEIQTFLLQKSE